MKEGKENRIGLYFHKNDEKEKRAYELIKKIKKRKTAFISALICDFMDKYDISEEFLEDNKKLLALIDNYSNKTLVEVENNSSNDIKELTTMIKSLVAANYNNNTLVNQPSVVEESELTKVDTTSIAFKENNSNDNDDKDVKHNNIDAIDNNDNDELMNDNFEEEDDDEDDIAEALKLANLF